MSAGEGESVFAKRQRIKKLIKIGQEMGLPITDNGDVTYTTSWGVETTNIYQESGLEPPRSTRSVDYGVWQINPHR